MAGFPPFDHAALGQKITKYADGPRWTPHYIDFMGVTVLVVVVEPPAPGDAIYTLQSNYNNFYAGMIFHRGTVHTEPAGPNEVTMLAKRAGGADQGPRTPRLMERVEKPPRVNCRSVSGADS